LIGKNSLEDLQPPAGREAARSDFKKLGEGKLTFFEGQSLASDGRVIPVEVRVRRIEYADKPALLLHVRDITQRRSAETAVQSSEMLFRSVWENSVDGMRLTDQNGLIIAVNSAFCRLVGMEAGALEGKPFTVVFAESDLRYWGSKFILQHYHSDNDILVSAENQWSFRSAEAH